MTEIRNGRRILVTPVTAGDLKDMHIGDVFYLDGRIATGRDAVHARVVEEGLGMPVDIRDGALLHAGPIVKDHGDGQYEMISVGPTTSMRMERFEDAFIKSTGVRVIIGKGGMKDKTAAACKEFGAIHCVFPAGNAVVAARRVEEIESVSWLDLGMPEAVWSCRVKELGPLIVTIDTDGRSFFEEKKSEYERIKEEQIAKISEKIRCVK